MQQISIGEVGEDESRYTRALGNFLAVASNSCPAMRTTIVESRLAEGVAI
jgi:hypothetical protein